MNPFKKDTTSYYDWDVLKDLKWHCTKCELKSGQAKTWQIWRHKGIQLDKDEKGNWYKRIFCKKCQNKTIFRKLKSLEILEETKIRSGIPIILVRKIKKLFKNTDALLLREYPTRELEVDHKFPQIRWGKDEKENEISMNEEDIRNKFILLTRRNNQLKSRQCERCVRDRIRGNFPGIYYWYKGDKQWKGKNRYDKEGCVGCFWYNPYKWREELNKLVKKIIG